MLSHDNESWIGDHSLWYCNLLELVLNLLGNPSFIHNMVYQPEKYFGSEGKLYSEIHQAIGSGKCRYCMYLYDYMYPSDIFTLLLTDI